MDLKTSLTVILCTCLISKTACWGYKCAAYITEAWLLEPYQRSSVVSFIKKILWLSPRIVCVFIHWTPFTSLPKSVPTILQNYLRKSWKSYRREFWYTSVVWIHQNNANVFKQFAKKGSDNTWHRKRIKTAQESYNNILYQLVCTEYIQLLTDTVSVNAK